MKIDEIRTKNKEFEFRYECNNFGRKPTMREILEFDLKNYWLSNYEMQQICKSSSADRTARTIRENPPKNYEMLQRKKDVPDEYGNCLEYHLVEIVDGQKRLF